MGQFDFFKEQVRLFIEEEERIKKLEQIAERLRQRTDIESIDPVIAQLLKETVKRAS